MINSLYIAETGLNAQKTFVDVISNNIANTNTSGFKKSNVNFVDLVVNPQESNGDIKSNSSNVYGVNVASITQDFSQGSLKPTGHPFDIAIHGEGFFEVNLNDQQLGYTRIGRLTINNDSLLSTIHGYSLSGDILIPPDTTNIVIESNGLVKGMLDGDEEFTELGRIELVNFSSPEQLIADADGVYKASEDAGEKTISIAGESGTGLIRQGYTEESNVSMVEEMVNLVIAQRGYQLNARVIQVSDQLLETINNLRR